jgi:hypothetical protein
MEYVLGIYEGPSEFAKREGPGAEEYWAAWQAYAQALRAAGQPMNGEALQPPESATTVRVRGGSRTIHDGPYADTKEQLGGFMVIDVPTLDEALEWAARCPAAAYGAVEVRPVLPTTAPAPETVNAN